MDALIYCRVSTERQAREGLSLAAQESECRKAAEAAGDTVVEVIRDPGYSGGSLDRPGMERLLRILVSHGAGAVYVWDLDRFSRSLRDQIEIAEAMLERGQRLVSVNQRTDYSTADGRFELHLMGSLAQRETEKTSERVRFALADKLERGEPVGKPPYGYAYDEAKRWVIVPEQAAVIRDVYRAYLAGDSLRTIARRLNAEEVPMADGGAYWQNAQVRRILTNTAYIGRLEWGDFEGPGNHDPIISEQIFQRARERRKRRARVHPRSLDRSLAPILRCGVCGAAVKIQTTSGYGYYHCVDQRFQPDVVHPDERLGHPERATNDILALHTRRLIMRGYTQAGADAIAEHAASAGNAERAREVADELAQVEEKIARNLEAYHAEAIPAELLREQNAPLMVRREELRELLDREAQAAGAPAPSDVRRITEATLDMVLREDRIDRLRELYALLYHPIELGADRTLTIRARWPVEPVVYHVPRGYSPDVRGDSLDLDELRLR